MRITDQRWRRRMHRASQCAQFALALLLPVAACAAEPWAVLPAAALSWRILRHLEDDQLIRPAVVENPRDQARRSLPRRGDGE